MVECNMLHHDRWPINVSGLRRYQSCTDAFMIRPMVPWFIFSVARWYNSERLLRVRRLLQAASPTLTNRFTVCGWKTPILRSLSELQQRASVLRLYHFQKLFHKISKRRVLFKNFAPFEFWNQIWKSSRVEHSLIPN